MLLAFPYAGTERAKVRPAMVVLDAGEADLVLARVTTRLHRTDGDVLIGDWRRAGLLAESVIRLHKVATLEKSLVQRRLGRLAGPDLRAVAATLRRLYGRADAIS